MKVATIEKIDEVRKHPNADALDIVKIKGWQVCVKRDEYKVGNLCIYICVDSIVHDAPPYEFLRNKNFRIKTVKLRGELSQGIVFPLSLLKEFGHDVITLDPDVVGTDVTGYIHAKHYEKPIPAQLAGEMVGSLPSFLKRTDEENIKNYPQLINEFLGKSYYISVKVDGSSGTFFVKDGDFGVCSRNWQLKENEKNGFWQVAKKHKINEKLNDYFRGSNYCLQGEVYGPGIESNLLGAKEISFSAYNLFDVDSRTYLGYPKLVNFCECTGIPMVKVIETGYAFNKTLPELQEFANSLTYDNGILAEGIVVRPLDECHTTTLKSGRLSGKIISEPFELKYG